MSETDVLTLDVTDRVATVTLNRPGARNALNRELRSALHRTVRDLDADDGVDVVVLTGASAPGSTSRSWVRARRRRSRRSVTTTARRRSAGRSR